MRLALHQFDAKESAGKSAGLEDPPAPKADAGADQATTAASTAKADVVFIHGTGSSSEMWQPQVELLNGLGYRCFVIDLRGHGKSIEPGEPTNLAVHNADVLQTIENSEVRFPAVFVGHSLGAIISASQLRSSARS